MYQPELYGIALLLFMGPANARCANGTGAQSGSADEESPAFAHETRSHSLAYPEA
jgi:hypothetical protein